MFPSRNERYALKNGWHLGGVARFLRLLPLFFICFFAPQASANPIELSEIAQLSRSGAAELALKLLEQNQPEHAINSSEWMRWERLRIRILEEQGSWLPLAQRLEHLPDGIAVEFVPWAMSRRAIALMHAGSYSESRQILRGLLWSDPLPSSARLAEYRQWLIQGYLQQGRTADALAAMLRYQQDYGEGGREALLLRARVLLAADRAGEAAALLAGIASDIEAGLLQQLAMLRGGESANRVLSQLNTISAENTQASSLQYLFFGTQAEAAAKAEHPAVLSLALHAYLQLPFDMRRREGLFEFSADDLWQAWLDYATQLANREQLLIGDDDAWLKAADETSVRYPVRKRSLYALLALRGGGEEVRALAHQRLAELLQEEGGQGSGLLRQLYLDAPKHLPRSQLPISLAHHLVDQAIREGDLHLASTLMQQLAEPPGDTARFAWQMRRAKVFILAGDYQTFDRLMDDILPQLTRLSATQRDQLIQLLFDLQHVEEHARAYALFAELYARLPIQALRRELLFWMADSKAALGQPVEAARLYLQSATLGNLNSMDPWAQTARYQAANSLARGGLLRDARYIYRQLLKVTENPERRAVLTRELEQVQMRLASDD